MRQKLLNRLSNNFGFKVLAFVLACTFWLVVYNMEDPSVTRTFTANVTVTNESVVADLEKCYEILNNSNTITFAVTAKRSVMDNLVSSDFRVVADMNNLVVGENGTQGNVPITVTPSRYSASVKVISNSKYLEIGLEDLLSKQFVVTSDVEGSVADGYALGSVTVAAPNVLKVSGPESLVSMIDSVVATIDVDGMSQDISDNVIPVLYDAGGNEIIDNRLEFSNSTVTVSAKILSIKSVNLIFSTSGTPAGENTVLGISSDPETVELKGTTSTLNKITSIEIPAEAVNVSGATADVTTKVDITEYLPEGTELVDPAKAQVSVTVYIETYGTRNINVASSRISMEGMDEEAYTYTFETSAVSVSVSGSDANLNSLTTGSIYGSVDVSDLGPGTHSLVVTLNLDEGKYSYATTRINVTIAEKEAAN